VLIDPALRIEKSARRLTVFSAGEPVRRYRIALGREPLGDKEREGDLRTPEGEFYVCTRNSESNHHRALGLSYPNVEDAERGLAEGMITKREHRAIIDAQRHMTRPPWKTALGGEIMIHGGGTETDWTEGCIALADDEAEELFDALPLGTPVAILR
jgi:murein L,D-transpeptidase YafK